MITDSVRENIRERIEKGDKIGSAFQGIAGTIGAMSDALVSIDIEPWNACAWTVTAGGWDGSPSTPVANQPNSAQWPNNFQAPLQTAPLQLGSSGGLAAQCGVLLRCEYGTHGTHEVVWFDYPILGTTWTVHAAHLRVYVDNYLFTPSSGAPSFSAFASPGQRESTAISPQRLTVGQYTIAFGTSATFFTPPRARAYRVYSTDTVGAANFWWTQGAHAQVDQSGSLIANDANYATLSQPMYGWLTEASRSRWYPLDPRAAAVKLTNQAGAGGPAHAGVQWLIDVG